MSEVSAVSRFRTAAVAPATLTATETYSDDEEGSTEDIVETAVQTAPVKRGPGRPRKDASDAAPVKRGPGRPRKDASEKRSQTNESEEDLPTTIDGVNTAISSIESQLRDLDKQYTAARRELGRMHGKLAAQRSKILFG